MRKVFKRSRNIAVLTITMLPTFAFADEAAEQIDRGSSIFAESCAVCHGEDGSGGAAYPNSIVGSSIAKYRTAKGLFDYNQMMMPFNDPSLLSAEEKLDVTAYILSLSGFLNEGSEPITAENAEHVTLNP